MATTCTCGTPPAPTACSTCSVRGRGTSWVRQVSRSCCSRSLIYHSRLAVTGEGRPPVESGAGDGNRTHVNSLEGCRTTIVLRPLFDLRPGSPEGIRTPDIHLERVAS